MAEAQQKNVMINLQEFVTESLVQIVEGVKTAQVRVSETGAKINPDNYYFDGTRYRFHPSGYSENEEFGQLVDFDVAVTAVDKGDLKGGIGVVGGVINLGYKAEKGLETSSVSRIKFSVPVFLPQQKT
jgi:hypothetical protein